jgi:hypothetical protein
LARTHFLDHTVLKDGVAVAHVLEDKTSYVSDIFIPASGNPALVIAAPMLGPGGEVVAVVGGSLSLTLEPND